MLYQHPKYDLVNAELDPNTQELRAVYYYEYGILASDYFE